MLGRVIASQAAFASGVGPQTVRDWGLRFNGGGPDALCEGRRTGRKATLDNEHRQALVVIVDAGPIPAGHEVVAGACAISSNGSGRTTAS